MFGWGCLLNRLLTRCRSWHVGAHRLGGPLLGDGYDLEPPAQVEKGREEEDEERPDPGHVDPAKLDPVVKSTCN